MLSSKIRIKGYNSSENIDLREKEKVLLVRGERNARNIQTVLHVENYLLLMEDVFIDF